MITNISSRLSLIDFMRRRWKRRIHPTIVALESYVEGFADAKAWEYDNTWNLVANWVHDFLCTKTEAQRLHWTESIAKCAPIKECQIAIFFAALDAGRGVRYEQISKFCPTQLWRDDFNRRQEQFFTGDHQRIMPAPYRIEIAKSLIGRWMMFYFDERGLRYYEIFQESEDALKSWAEACLKIPIESWEIKETAR
jgi:hypothetical protein